MLLTPLYKKGEGPPKPPYGVHKKPEYCKNNCPRAYKASGFVADYVPAHPKIAFMFELPGKDDVTQCKPMAGGFGRYFWAVIGHRLGIKKEDVIFSHVLRCYSYGNYPTGKDNQVAEIACRYWDKFHNIEGHPTDERSLISWNPNIFICTFGLKDMINLGAYQALALADIEKAWRFAKAGYRPLVLLDTGAMSVVAPWLTGGIKKWRGHWWEGSWKWKQPETPKVGFSQAKYKLVGRQQLKKKISTEEQGKLF